ncbi:MAG: helix-turn-helix transcriptional regulator [Winogradskyella sp.]|uniref:helix-turn-helix transcriptional regulator n=1 Tax=Winogradskyella sp. TaxID=1883156 RepID=UPI00180E9C46|nr:helix-turn-helix transcriptional regulator [Winogradskyella sp.]
MRKLKFGAGNYLTVLNEFAETLGCDIHSTYNVSSIKLDGIYGKGNIAATKVSDELFNLSIDATLTEDLEMSLYNKTAHDLDFIYCLEGHVDQEFPHQSKIERINFRQNSIIGRTPGTRSIIKLLAGIPVKVSLSIYSRPLHINLTNQQKSSDLREIALRELSNNFLQERFRYLGRVCFKTALFAERIIQDAYITATDLLYKEAAILNVIASQVERHLEDAVKHNSETSLRKSEIDKIIALESFICNNISENLAIERLSAMSGLNPAKLQLGFHYLFNNTISSYIKEKRLDKAAELIKETEFNVSELVYSVGFSSRSYFSKIFKQRYGVLPSKCVSNPNLLMAV